MCLLVQQPKKTEFTEDFIKDVYSRNSDGFGVMYAEGGKVHVYKVLPTNADEMVDFYNQYAKGRDCIWHARMKTHGDIDFENCHPYRVTDDIWLAHNGVLSSGNAADHTKSDTWHFIKNVLKPALSHEPDLMLDPEWCRFIGNIIGGSNKFGLMRSDGEFSIINEKSGVNFVGAWLSNTYAWSPSRFGFQPPASTGHKGYYSYYQKDEDEDWTNYKSWAQGSLIEAPKTKVQAPAPQVITEVKAKPTEAQARRFIQAAYNSWSRRGLAGIEQWVYDAPEKASWVLTQYYEDCLGIEDLVYSDPDEAAVWIEDLFRTDCIKPSWLA